MEKFFITRRSPKAVVAVVTPSSPQRFSTLVGSVMKKLFRKVVRESALQREYHCKKNSPTAIALGSSAIVKVLGQNCFRTLYGSLGQIRLGLLKGSVEGSTKVPPSLALGSSAIVKV